MVSKMELEVEIPEEVDVNIENDAITIHGKRGSVTKRLPFDVKIEKKDNKIIIHTGSKGRRGKAILGTTKGELKNMIKGVTEGITYKLRILYSHFPMNVKVQGDTVIIENFLGERHPRKSKILENVKVDIKGHEVVVTGIDKEMVAQTAANLEQATRIKNLDPRVFQDGIYIIEKDGKPIV